MDTHTHRTRDKPLSQQPDSERGQTTQTSMPPPGRARRGRTGERRFEDALLTTCVGSQEERGGCVRAGLRSGQPLPRCAALQAAVGEADQDAASTSWQSTGSPQAVNTRSAVLETGTVSVDGRWQEGGGITGEKGRRREGQIRGPEAEGQTADAEVRGSLTRCSPSSRASSPSTTIRGD